MLKKTKKIIELLFTISAIAMISFVSLPPLVDAQASLPVVNVPISVYVGAGPDPVGVGQAVGIVYWTDTMAIPTPGDLAFGAPGGRECWTGITVTVTKPDGTKETIAFPPSDPVGGGYYSYVPDQIGEYSIQAHFPAQWRNRTSTPTWGTATEARLGYNLAYFNCNADDSEIDTFNVTEKPLEWLPASPLPTEYWTRPIHGFLKGWFQTAGNWITGNPDNQYITAPSTAHVVWTEPYFYGGIAGGTHEDIGYYEGTSYEAKFSGVTIMQGKLFYNLNLGSSSSGSYRKIIARDLSTGKQLWELNGTSITASTIYEYSSRNQHGLHPYLWITGNIAVDPFSGTELFRFTNVPSGTEAVGPSGERLLYVIGGTTSNRTSLALFNFSAPLSMTGITTSQLATYRATGLLAGTDYDQWRPVGKVHNGSDAYSWNASLPKGLSGNIEYALDDRIIGTEGFGLGAIMNDKYRVWAVSTEEGRRGQLLWDIRPKAPAANGTLQISSVSLKEGVLILRYAQERQYMCFDLNTGQQLWISEPAPQWMYYSSGSTIANGKLYACGYGGEIFAYDIKTGDLLWTAAADAEGFESIYERSPLGMVVVGNKIVARSTEHSMTHPFYRTWKTYCFDAETGQRIWDLAGTGTGYSFADGYMIYMQFADLQIYCIGKGPSSTSIAASPKVSSQGNSVIVEGSVFDISAGTNSDALTARFPNGVPAISDNDMSAWMEHVYMQMPKPDNAKGVEVIISVLDPNNNYYTVGNATSDADGFFKTTFTPEIPGEYTVIASFEGSDSYWPSQAKTAIAVTQAASQPTQQPVTAQSNMEMYIIGVGIAIIIAVAIVGALILIVVRKRP